MFGFKKSLKEIANNKMHDAQDNALVHIFAGVFHEMNKGGFCILTDEIKDIVRKESNKPGADKSIISEAYKLIDGFVPYIEDWRNETESFSELQMALGFQIRAWKQTSEFLKTL